MCLSFLPARPFDGLPARASARPRSRAPARPAACPAPAPAPAPALAPALAPTCPLARLLVPELEPARLLDPRATQTWRIGLEQREENTRGVVALLLATAGAIRRLRGGCLQTHVPFGAHNTLTPEACQGKYKRELRSPAPPLQCWRQRPCTGGEHSGGARQARTSPNIVAGVGGSIRVYIFPPKLRFQGMTFRSRPSG